jgi:hypothetical protein
VVGRADDELRGFDQGQPPQRIIVGRDDQTGLGEQSHPGRGEPGPAPVRFDEGPPEHALESANVLADRRLAQLEARGGTMEAARIGHRDQAP